ncbi:FYVE zinc finger-domain-containing protein [Cadophora sp. MPI-SDFR-AT-0126]|nr:FYVE zinc finger-domain-containing protein [Leotiomycetes sp. MPI-SDFR-AT-0126]
MDPRTVSTGSSTTNSALNERPLPPLPISDADSVVSGEMPGDNFVDPHPRQQERHMESAAAGSANPSLGSIHQDSSDRVGSSAVLPAELERLSLRNLESPSHDDPDPVVSSHSEQEETSRLNPVPADDESSTGVETQTRTSIQLTGSPQNAPQVRNRDRAPRPARNLIRSENSSGSDSTGDSAIRETTATRTRNSQQNLDGTQNMEQTQFVVPKWQPDATVTLCPICRTQFSFFVRKHHCRKCGRVVCGSCSPHRITIPYQYIVQPPTAEEIGPAPRTRARFDSGRTGSSPVVENLGGGERVRLCNPCVPDPNVAPPQVPESRNSQPRPAHQGHSRSVSSVVTSNQNRNIGHSPSYSSYYSQRRPRDTMNSYNTSNSSYSERNSRLRPEDLQSRSRSSTVGTNRDPSNMGNSASAVGQWTGPQGRSEPPQMSSSRLPPAPRPVIREEDECWICHKELPSRNLENWENLRAEHVNNCLVLAMQGPSTSSSPSPSPAPITIPSQMPRTTTTRQAEGSRTARVIPAVAPPIANTPEARMAARERAHAAVVLASSSTSPIRRTGVFPYKATEKDCIDDAECTICLEEFEVGEDMGRLECFCRFHLKCIREWFVNRPGQCPVHQHGAGY